MLSEVLAAASADQDGVVELARRLVMTPSRGGIDPYQPVLDIAGDWLRRHGLPAQTLRDVDRSPVGLWCEVVGGQPGPRWVLSACLDTAPFGDETAWRHPPTSAHLGDGWLWGRGSADSKVGAAIFCHIAARLAPRREYCRGALTLLLDVDEHTGRFGGAKRYFEGPDAPTDVAGVMIGYPGQDALVVGGRGVLRARLRVYGVASHSGARNATSNAVGKAAQLVAALAAAPLPSRSTRDFPLPPKLTVTEIHGGEGYSITPDLCTLAVDVRTTPVFDAHHARRLLREAAHAVDRDWPDTRPTAVDVHTDWPPYHTGSDSPVRQSLLGSTRALGLQVEPKISGMSNIGNYLAGLGIPATAGFGVAYEGVHAIDERIRLDTIPLVHAAYHATMLDLLA